MRDDAVSFYLFDVFLAFFSHLQENVPAGANVLLLNVTDNDSLQNGPPFSFSIVKGDEMKPFSIDQQGLVKTSGLVRRGQHTFKVQVCFVLLISRKLCMENHTVYGETIP